MTWLNRPYPHIEDQKTKLSISFFMGLVCFIFLLTFQPFGLSDISENQGLYIFFFGLNCTLALLIAYFILPRLFIRYFKPVQWKVSNEIIFFLVVLLMISVFNYLYNSILLKDMTPQHDLLKFVGMTSAVGVLPILMMTYITEKVVNQRNVNQAEILNDHVDQYQDVITDDVLHLQSETVKSDVAEMRVDDFIYAEAEKNYATIYYLYSGQLTKILLRLSLKSILNQVKEESGLVRCHKSFVINKSKIRSIDGNARSLVILLEHIDSPIPVSRSFDQNLLKVASHTSHKTPI